MTARASRLLFTFVLRRGPSPVQAGGAAQLRVEIGGYASDERDKRGMRPIFFSVPLGTRPPPFPPFPQHGR